jgi:serine/threonine-protein kinase RsbW
MLAEAPRGSRTSKSWTLPAEPESVGRLRREVALSCRAMQVDPETVEAVKLAVSESVSNVILHGYVGERPGGVTLSVAFPDDEVVISVRDTGRGMAPRFDSPGLGMGLPIIAHVARQLDIHPAEGGGTVVQMRFGR